MNWGAIWATAGAVIAALLAGIGSAIGVGITGQASAGVVSENPDLSGKCLLLQLLPGTQGIYGLLIAIVIMSNSGLMGDAAKLAALEANTALGVRFFLAGLPIAFGGLLSALYQGTLNVCENWAGSRASSPSSHSAHTTSSWEERLASADALVGFLLR